MSGWDYERFVLGMGFKLLFGGMGVFTSQSGSEEYQTICKGYGGFRALEGRTWMVQTWLGSRVFGCRDEAVVARAVFLKTQKISKLLN